MSIALNGFHSNWFEDTTIGIINNWEQSVVLWPVRWDVLISVNYQSFNLIFYYIGNVNLTFMKGNITTWIRLIQSCKTLLRCGERNI